jgi:phosphate acyltransferase
LNGFSRLNLIIDAMGGDFAPDEIIKGAIEGCSLYGAELTLVGDKEIIKNCSEKNNFSLDEARIINSTDTVFMDDSPSDVLKYKKNSPVYLASEYASKIENSAFLSAGNTGAAMACALFNMRKIEGVFRPAIAIVIPLGSRKFVLIDGGANTEVKPVYLQQFAIMGKVYCREILKVKDPRIGLLNIGSEEKKGNEITRESYKLLKETKINFVGNVEGRDIFEGAADVVVCDGFTGNILLKAIEGMAGFFFGEIKKVFLSNFITKVSSLILKKYFKSMKKQFDYEEYGGALLLGINGIAIISHGSSGAKAIKNAVRVARDSVNNNLISKISSEIKG